MLLADIEEDVLPQRLGAVRVGLTDLVDLRFQRRVQPGGHVEVLLELFLDLPDIGLFLLDGGIVLTEFILPAIERLDDRIQMPLCRLVATEVIAQSIPEGDQTEQAPWTEGPLPRGVKVLDGAP